MTFFIPLKFGLSANECSVIALYANRIFLLGAARAFRPNADTPFFMD